MRWQAEGSTNESIHAGSAGRHCIAFGGSSIYLSVAAAGRARAQAPTQVAEAERCLNARIARARKGRASDQHRFVAASGAFGDGRH